MDVTTIALGDPILCRNAEGVEKYGFRQNVIYDANSVTAIPGQGEFIGVFVKETGKIVVVEADRFEKCYKLQYRVWPDGDYVLLEEYNENDYEHKSDDYADTTVTIPESMLDQMDDVVGAMLTKALYPPQAEE